MRRDQEDELERAEQAARAAGSRSARRCAGSQHVLAARRSRHRPNLGPARRRGRYGQAVPGAAMPAAILSACARADTAIAGGLAVAARRRGRGRATQRGTLDVRHRVDYAGGAYIEGSVVLSARAQQAAHRAASSARARGQHRTSGCTPRAGLYRVVELPAALRRQLLAARPAHRPLLASGCSVYAGGADPGRAVTRPGNGCTMRVAEPPPFPSTRRVAGGAALRPRPGDLVVRPDRHPRPPARLRARTGATSRPASSRRCCSSPTCARSGNRHAERLRPRGARTR